MRVIGRYFLWCLPIALAACAHEVPPPAESVDVPGTIQVDHLRSHIALAFAPGSAVLAAADAARLDAAVAESRGPAGLHASIGLAAGDPLGDRRFLAVVRALRQYGIVATAGGPPAERGQVAIEFDRYVALPPPCPAQRYDTLATDSVLRVRAQGCTTAGNLAAMLADPADLVADRGHGPFDGVPAAAAVARYRADQTTPLIVTPDLPIGTSAPAPTPSSGAGGGASQGGGS